MCIKYNMSKKSHRRSTKNIRRKTYRGGVKLRDIATAALLMSNPAAAGGAGGTGRSSSRNFNQLKKKYLNTVTGLSDSVYDTIGRTTGRSNITNKLKKLSEESIKIQDKTFDILLRASNSSTKRSPTRSPTRKSKSSTK